MTAALTILGNTILAILIVSVIRTEGRLSRLEAKLDVLTDHMLPAPPQQQVEAQQSSPAATPTQAPATQPATAPR